MTTLQQLVDNVRYPQNLYYDVKTIEPKGLLINRCNFFKKYCPELFEKHKSFLDIGCATGYFLFYHARNNSRVVGIEPNIELFKLCSLINLFRNTSVEIFNVKFVDYKSNEKFELVFLGNCFHYLYKEQGWKIFNKLSDICEHKLIIEAPLESSHLVEINGWFEEDKNYTQSIFLDEACKFFKLVGVFESGTIGKRNIVVLEK